MSPGDQPAVAPNLAYAGPQTPESPLTRGDLATLALRVLGILLAALSLPNLIYGIMFSFDLGGAVGFGGGSQAMLFLLPGLVTTLCGVMLIVLARPIGQVALPGTAGGGGATFTEWHAAALMLLGTWLLITGAAEGLQLIISWQMERRAAADEMFFVDDVGFAWAAAMIPLVHVVAGLVLFLQSRGVVNLWRRIHHPPSASRAGGAAE